MQASTSFSRAAVPAVATGTGAQRVRFSAARSSQVRFRTAIVARCEGKVVEPADVTELDPESESAKKQAEIDSLRAAEKFMTKGDGDADCGGCGYKYEPSKGDPDFPIPKGMMFAQLPDDYICPICGAPKSQFKENVVTVAGFEENQGYGFGTNAMTEADKSKLIYGSLVFFFFLFISGYFLN